MDLNKVKNIVSIIFLGALGSGLWNIAGEPTAGILYSSLTSAGGWLSTSYGDLLNNNIGSGGWDSRGSAILMMLIVWGAAIFVQRMLLPATNMKGLRYLGVATVFLFSIFSSHKVIHSLGASLYFNKSIEIIAPYVTQTEYLHLRANYRRIEDLASFNKAQKEILEYSKIHNLNIKPFSL